MVTLPVYPLGSEKVWINLCYANFESLFCGMGLSTCRFVAEPSETWEGVADSVPFQLAQLANTIL